MTMDTSQKEKIDTKFRGVFKNKFLVLSFLFTIVLLLGILALLIWSWTGPLEESVPGMGSFRPEGKIQRVMSPQDGIVTELFVSENDEVKAGQPLFELDPELTEIEKEGLTQQLKLLQDESSALVSAYTNQNLLNNDSIQQEWLSETRQNYNTQLKAAEMQINEAFYSYQKVLTNIEETKKIIKTSEALFARYLELQELGGIAENDVKEMEQKLLQQKANLKVLQEEAKAYKYQLERVKKQPLQLQTQFNKDILSKLIDYQKNIAQLKTDFSKTKTILQRQIIRSPVDGYINEQIITGEQEVVRAGEPLLTIVPKDARLIAELQVANKDMSYIYIGQPVLMMIEAYPYQKFGKFTGYVESISPSTVMTEQGMPVYKVIVIPERQKLLGEENQKVFDLRPGMTVTADFITRKKNIISFIIEPILKTLDRAARDPSSR